MGLAISAFVSTEDQATSLTPLAVIPQLLFAGAIVPVDQMGPIVKALSYVMFSQWSFAGGDRGRHERADRGGPEFARVNPFGTRLLRRVVRDGPASCSGSSSSCSSPARCLLLARSVRR